MAKTPEEVQAQLDEELSKLLALRESILGSEIKNYNDLIRDRKELQDKEEQLNQDKNDALKMQEDANEDLKKKQDELNSTQETLNDEQLTNLKNEISNLENEAKTAQQLHDDTITELQTRQDSLNTFNDSINAFDERMRATEGFAEQEQTVQELEDENQSFKESVSKFSDTINSFYQSLTGTAIAPTGEEPSWVKVIVGAILSIVPTTDPLQLEKSDEKPTTDPFLAEKAKEEEIEQEKARKAAEDTAKNTEDIADAVENLETDSDTTGIGGLIALLAGAAIGFVTSIAKQIWDLGTGVVKLVKGLAISIGKLFNWLFGDIGKSIKKLIPQKVIDLLTDGFDAIKKFFGKIGGFFKKILGFGGKVDDVADAATGGLSFFGKIKKFFGFLQPVFGVIDDLFKPLKSMFGAGLKIGSKFGKLLGPVGVVITVIDAVVKAIQGFTKGFAEGGIIEGIKGGLLGIFDSLIGSVVNLGADLIGWITKKLGFEEVGQSIMNFDIMTPVRAFMDFLFVKIPDIFRNLLIDITSIGDNISQLFQGFDLWQTIKDGIIGIIPNIFGMKAKVAEMFGTTITEAQERQTDTGAKFSNFTKNIKEIVLRRIVDIFPKALGIRKKVAEILNVPLDKTGDAINMNPAKEEADRRKFVQAKTEQMEMEMKFKGATEEQIEKQREAMKLDANNQFEKNYDTARMEGENIVTYAKDALKETKRNLIDKQKENEQEKEKAQKGTVATAINAPSTTQNNTTVSSDTIAAPAASQDAAFLQSMAKGLVTQMGW